ncbi:S4 domain-containing protein YaaA [Streptococcus moroccensis]|uniref:S4 domain protein YaaA n=1 Tax=Streptococcus moroccensis TaxID=1451356 RepID=A0ABT9YS08_9STRE|nr:S4 domain-containing protein YaaA [Streptococcus moroccensis]MDQ0222555.1 S4 domain protein YaaA [Streptococcus moroccensis]
MDYKLFEEFITLQALLKDLGIISSGGAIKGFLAEETVLFNGQDEKRRGKKIRIGDVVELPGQGIRITISEPTSDEKQTYEEDKAEKERVAAIVKSLNSETKKKVKAHKQVKNKSSKPAVRFPGT